MTDLSLKGPPLSVLVTGGAGFIGSHLVDELVRRGAAVTVADNFSTGSIDNLSRSADKIAIERVDLAHDDLAVVLRRRPFDTIIHAAANAYIPSSVEDPHRDLEDNVLATHNLLVAVRRICPEVRLVNLSSAAVYGEGTDTVFAEDHPTRPESPYGVSKLAAELYVGLYARLYGLRTSSLRLFSVFGPRLRKQVIWDFMNRLAADPSELVIHGDGTEERDLNHVANVVHAVRVVMERAPMRGELYNVAARNTVSIIDVARRLSSVMGISPVFRRTGRRRPGDSRSWKADTRRLDALGYRPPMGFAEGLADTVAWFQGITSRSGPVQG